MRPICTGQPGEMGQWLIMNHIDVSHLLLSFSAANAKGYFNAEIAPVEVKVKKGKEMFSVDEHPRQTTIEKLSSLPPVFKENGTVSAGNASVRKRENTP